MNFARRSAQSLQAASRSRIVYSSFRPTQVARAASTLVPRVSLNCYTPSCFACTTRRFSGEVETREFQAETRKLLDIVTHSIYTDKEVFLRELVSNASDALEKYRYKQVLGEAGPRKGMNPPLEISINIDEERKILTITDSGIGMTREDLISHLGTIARSGSKQFVESLKEKGSRDGDSIIGQFGVGFYSAFMVADTVSVESTAAVSPDLSDSDIDCNKWSSDGSGKFTMEKVTEDPVYHGSRITLHLKDSCHEFANAERIKSIVKKYSSFVSFPVRVNGDIVNSVSAIWLQDKKNVTETQYDEFYKFISNAFDKPRYTLHFRADAPIDLKCLFFVPTFHTEKFGMGRMESGINLYSRKVLIESKPKDILPEWLRFVKGVVDSEDLPLSLSREKPQDSSLIRRIRDVLTRKMIRFLEEKMKDNLDGYREFYTEYNMFLKEGVCHDHRYMDQISKLLMFESSGLSEGEMTTFDEYISRCPPEQKAIYYLIAPSRSAALQSPYYETFKKHNKEVLLLYHTVDDFVMSNIKKYGDRDLLSAETSSIDFASEAAATTENAEEATNSTKLSDADSNDLCTWLKMTLGENRVREVRVTKRLSGSPAIVTDHESGALRRMMKLVDQANAGRYSEVPPQVFEINPDHPLIYNLFQAHNANPEMSRLVAEQLFDNALISAGLVEDPRMMVPRLNEILAASLKK